MKSYTKHPKLYLIYIYIINPPEKNYRLNAVSNHFCFLQCWIPEASLASHPVDSLVQRLVLNGEEQESSPIQKAKKDDSLLKFADSFSDPNISMWETHPDFKLGSHKCIHSLGNRPGSPSHCGLVSLGDVEDLQHSLAPFQKKSYSRETGRTHASSWGKSTISNW